MNFSLAQLLQNITTTKDGNTFDIVRVLTLFGALIYFGLAVWAVVVNKEPFHMQDFAIGLGAMMAGAGAGIGMKAKDEPPTSS